jgi:hypothetical protein
VDVGDDLVAAVDQVAAIGAPMMPRPMKPMVDMCVSSLISVILPELPDGARLGKRALCGHTWSFEATLYDHG